MERMEIRGIGEAHREISQDDPFIKEERDAGDIDYTYMEKYRRDTNARTREPHYMRNMVAITIPSNEEMQKRPQELVPQVIITIKEDRKEDFESFIEDDPGVLDESDHRHH